MRQKIHGTIHVQYQFGVPASGTVTRGELYGLDANGHLVAADLTDASQDGKAVVMALESKIGAAAAGEVRALCLVKGVLVVDATGLVDADIGKTVCVIDNAGTPELDALTTPNTRPVGVLLGLQNGEAYLTNL